MQNLFNNMGGMYKNFDGGSNTNFSQYSVPKSPFFSSTSSTTPTKAKFDYFGTGKQVLDLGVKIWSSEQERKNAEKQANALIAQGISAERVQQLINEGKRLDLETAKAGVVGGKSGSTVLYVAVGVGAVVILGVVIFAVTRKKA